MFDRYEPGDEVTLVGYSAGCVGAPGISSDLPPLQAFLYPDLCARREGCRAQLPRPPGGTYLGTFTFDGIEHDAYGQRMELDFTLGADVGRGVYDVMVCRDPCYTYLGPPTLLYVGLDPPDDGRSVRSWPVDEPALADLPDDVLIVGADGRTVSVITARAKAAASPTSSSGRSERSATGGSGRVETAAPSTGERGDDLAPAKWLAGAVLFAGAAWLMSRRPSSRKRVRGPGPD